MGSVNWITLKDIDEYYTREISNLREEINVLMQNHTREIEYLHSRLEQFEQPIFYMINNDTTINADVLRTLIIENIDAFVSHLTTLAENLDTLNSTFLLSRVRLEEKLEALNLTQES